MREDWLNWRWVSLKFEGGSVKSQKEKKKQKRREEEMVKEKTRSLVDFKEKLLCLSILLFSALVERRPLGMGLETSLQELWMKGIMCGVLKY